MRAACLDWCGQREKPQISVYFGGDFQVYTVYCFAKAQAWIIIETDECDRVRKMEVCGNDKFGE